MCFKFRPFFVLLQFLVVSFAATDIILYWDAHQ